MPGIYISEGRELNEAAAPKHYHREWYTNPRRFTTAVEAKSTFRTPIALQHLARRGTMVYQFVTMPTQTSTLGRRGGQQVRQWLLEKLASGLYSTGAKLPTERAVAEQLSVPRSAVRNALAALEAEGVIVRLIGSGTFVAERPTTQGLESHPSLMTVGDASPTEIMDARLLIEPRIAALAVAHATQGDFERMEACNRNAENSDDFERFERWDVALHQAIAEATHNRLIVGLYTVITRARAQADWGELKRRSLTPERRDHYREEHRRVVAALRSRDSREAETALLDHLRHVRRNLLGI
jgi:DNA-binding FadR family transcriptional regulator